MITEKRKENICVGDVVVISGVRPMGKSYRHRQTGRANHGILYVRSGEATFYLQEGILKVTDGQLLYLPQGLEYKMQYTGESTSFVVVNFDLWGENTAPVSLFDGVKVLTDPDPTHSFESIMTKLELCGAAQNLSGQFRRKELLCRLLAVLCSSQELPDGGQYPRIGEGVRLLKQTYLENLSIETFAAACSLSESAFRQLFRKQYGISPLQYRNRLRIQRARELLEYDHCTVAEAAYASGFENLGYFCRCYKKITGQTPKQTKQTNL